jgi:lysophospholipase L1-like esterase
MKTNTILCVGDSHTAGYPGYDPYSGGNLESTYQYWLERELQKEYPQAKFLCINKGHCGDTSSGIVQRLCNVLKTGIFDLVILSGGTNDLSLANSDQIFFNLQRGYAYCLMKYNVPVVACAIPPLNFSEYVSTIKAVNTAIEDYAKQNRQILFADWFNALQDEHGLLANTYDAGDGVHLSVAGYKRIGTLLAHSVRRLLRG